MKRKLVLPIIFTTAGLLVVGWFVTRIFFFEFFTLPSESMQPTLMRGGFVTISKWGYGNYRLFRIPILKTNASKKPQRGEVFVFFPPLDERYFIKRVIGLPGDVVEIKNNFLSINGEAITQELVSFDSGNAMQIVKERLADKTYRIGKRVESRFPQTDGRWTVPENHYFVLGDNRDNSQDSRFWGTVPRENFVGKLVSPLGYEFVTSE